MLKFIGGLTIDILHYIYGGFVLSVLWGWFLVPLGLPPIGIGIAIGLILIGYILASNSSSLMLSILFSERWGMKEVLTLKFGSVTVLTLAWFLGWVTQLVFL